MPGHHSLQSVGQSSTVSHTCFLHPLACCQYCLVPFCGVSMCSECKFLLHSRRPLPVRFPLKVVDEQVEISGHHRAARDMFDVILCRGEPLLELLDFVEVEHGFCNVSLYLFVARFDVQARNMRDLPVPDRPSLLCFISQLQALGECLDELQIQCTAFATQSGGCIKPCKAMRPHG